MKNGKSFKKLSDCLKGLDQGMVDMLCDIKFHKTFILNVLYGVCVMLDLPPEKD